jgi:hypothetical protein
MEIVKLGLAVFFGLCVVFCLAIGVKTKGGD